MNLPNGLLILYVGTALAQTAEESLDACQKTVAKEGEKFVKGTVKAAAGCLQKISGEIIKKNASDASKAANACVAKFRKINDSRGLGKSLEEKLQAKITEKCDPATNAHTLADILGTGAGVPEPINAENIDTWCQNFGGDGSIDTLQEWIDCVVAAHTCQANQAISVQYPRALEWLDDVKPFMQALTPPVTDPDKITDAVAALDALDQALDSDGDDALDIACGGAFPASGQTTAFTADKNDGIPGAVAVPDDGTVEAGATLSYTDNGDGTITDNNTGLMWEKKSDDGGLHDWDNQFRWSGDGAQETIWDWLDDVNVEGGTGFAGHTDWRIPNVKELSSIVDHGAGDPSVDPVFNTGCVDGCTVLTCSCTAACRSFGHPSTRPSAYSGQV